MAESAGFFQNFMPHGMCYAWQPGILWLNVLSDLAIALAYFSIPFALFFFLRERRDAPFRGVLIMFSVFIFACGLTHVISIWNVWHGYYGVMGLAKAGTALASIATAVMLFPVMPRLIALRSPVELAAANDALKFEITQREKTDLQSRRLQQEVEHMGRVATMGEMATGLAHELNQPLAAIALNADAALYSAKEQSAGNPELIQMLKDIEEQSLRAGDIIRAVRQYIRKEPPELIEGDINSLIKQTVRLVEPESRENQIEIVLALDPLPKTRVDRVQIAQAMTNLLRNSVQALSGHAGKLKRIAVSTAFTSDEITIVIDDTGPGIDPNIDLFRSFETSKANGMGVGLQISKAMIAAHGGHLREEEKDTPGARFVISLPTN